MSHPLFPLRLLIECCRSIAGAATQGVPGAHVHATSPRKKKPKTKKAAYVVFCGRRCGVFDDWSETKVLVSGVPNCIYRGYTTREAARAAFQYAVERSWTRVADAAVTTPIPALPQPLDPNVAFDTNNPLTQTEALDDRWYIVYRGICPGVYRSHLECQLNTLGVRRSLHESIVGRAAAFAKYNRALAGGQVSVVPPTYYGGVDGANDTDPFI
ncbi:hypothetical protein B0H16DRAFT_1483973 [Mycena metata]|uniref:Ribonuclease H1 N-terminal domain-containing protein n=1 Tax=Mycena metata TaxID=1033252 RepID=A0AAD7GQL4_9AGAR|nr:hypothetical protein B0H16DRAFT_1483973 [Mycena metata]